MCSWRYFLGQQDEPLAVSQVAVFVVSQPAGDPGGQHDSFGAAGAEGLKSLKAVIPIAAMMMTTQRMVTNGFFFFGGQQLPSQPQSLFPVAPPPGILFVEFSSIVIYFFAFSIFHCPATFLSASPDKKPGIPP
jgi:hypothetical protein